MTYDLGAIRARLDDPMDVATQLGLIDGRGSFQRLARGLLVRCPAHTERTPSCSLSSTGGDGVVFHCFGCDARGGVFELVAAVAGLDARGDFRRVVEIAAQMAGVVEGEDAPAFAPPPRPPEPPRLDDDTFDAIAEVIARACPVGAQPDVAAYLRARGLYEVGAPVLAALPAEGAAQTRVVGEIVAAVGEEAWALSGLANSSRWGFAFPAHRLCIFWRGDGVAAPVQTVQRRLIRAPWSKSEPKYVFASRRQPRRPYGLEFAEALGPGGEVAFVEGALDALAMRALCARHGVDRLVLGIPGVSAWSRPWAAYAAGRVAVVALDDDEAGEAKAREVGADLYAAGAADVRRVVPEGDCKDWCDLLARETGVAA